MMISRLFMLLTDNERKKSHGKRYEFTSSKDQSINRDIIAPSSPGQHTPASQAAATGISLADGFPASPSEPVPVSREDTMPEDETEQNQIMDMVHVNETSKTKSQSLSHGRKRRKRVTVSKLDAIQFHDKTYGHNKLILVISKFFIILIFVVLSSQFVLIMFIIFRDRYTP